MSAAPARKSRLKVVKPPETTFSLGDYLSNYLQCRDTGIGHTWRVVGHYRDGVSGISRVSRCEVCHQEKTEYFNSTGAKWRSDRRIYPENYSVPSEVGLRSQDFRAENLRRVAKVYGSVDEMFKDLGLT